MTKKKTLSIDTASIKSFLGLYPLHGFIITCTPNYIPLTIPTDDFRGVSCDTFGEVVCV